MHPSKTVCTPHLVCLPYKKFKIIKICQHTPLNTNIILFIISFYNKFSTYCSTFIIISFFNIKSLVLSFSKRGMNMEIKKEKSLVLSFVAFLHIYRSNIFSKPLVSILNSVIIFKEQYQLDSRKMRIK